MPSFRSLEKMIPIFSLNSHITLLSDILVYNLLHFQEPSFYF